MDRMISRAGAALLALCAATGPAAADDAATCTKAEGDESTAACTRLLASNPDNALAATAVIEFGGKSCTE
jgi:hypothetical protein